MSRSINSLKYTETGVLPPNQEGAALSLASGSTIAETAKTTNMAEPTIKSWLRLPEFINLITELRSEMTERALGKLLDGMTAAAEQLRRLATMGRSEQVRLGACRALIEMATRLRENTEKNRADLLRREEFKTGPTQNTVNAN